MIDEKYLKNLAEQQSNALGSPQWLAMLGGLANTQGNLGWQLAQDPQRPPIGSQRSQTEHNRLLVAKEYIKEAKKRHPEWTISKRA